jgi:acetyl-CoA C-acetyltransferase
MTDAYIYDATRTPRGKGKKNGSLHEITALQLATQQLQAIRDRNNLDTSFIDDVVLGCVSPVGEQGADIARAAALNANYAETASGFQVNRFCASGLEAVNLAAAKVMSGEADLAIGGGVEAMSRVPMGSDGGAMAVDPEMAFDHYFVPQGVSADLIATKYGYSRDDVDAYAVESQNRAEKAWKERRFDKSVVPVKDQLGLVQLDHDEHMRPGTDMQSLASLKPSFKDLSAIVGFDKPSRCRNTPMWRRSTSSTMPATPRASWTAPPPCCRLQGNGRGARPQAARPHPRHGVDRLRADHHADRPGAVRRARR